MNKLQNRRVLLARRPVGEPNDDDFRLETDDVAEPADGEVLVQVAWLSIDPYMRGRMNDAQSYAKPVELGEVMVGGTVARVLRWVREVCGFECRDYKAGDLPAALAAACPDGIDVVVSEWIAELPHAPEALHGVLSGKNFGKMLVQVAHFD